VRLQDCIFFREIASLVPFKKFGDVSKYGTETARTIEVRVPRAHHKTEPMWLQSTQENNQYQMDV
jgi:hypothetical protein